MTDRSTAGVSGSDEHAPEDAFATERDPRLRILIPMIVAVAFLMEQLVDADETARRKTAAIERG